MITLVLVCVGQHSKRFGVPNKWEKSPAKKMDIYSEPLLSVQSILLPLTPRRFLMDTCNNGGGGHQMPNREAAVRASRDERDWPFRFSNGQCQHHKEGRRRRSERLVFFFIYFGLT